MRARRIAIHVHPDHSCCAVERRSNGCARMLFCYPHSARSTTQQGPHMQGAEARLHSARAEEQHRLFMMSAIVNPGDL